MEFLNAIDSWLFLRLNADVANGFLDVVMPYYTNIHYWRWPIIAALALVAAFGGGKGRSIVLIALVTLTITDQLSSTYLKPWIGRTRPCHVVEGARFITGCGHSLAMPSGHATNTMAAAILFGLAYRRFLILLLTLSITVSYSRIYLGIHYPGDILVGWIIGGSIAFGMLQLYERALRRYMDRWPPFRRKRKMVQEPRSPDSPVDTGS